MKRALTVVVTLLLAASCRSPRGGSSCKATAEILSVSITHDTLVDGGFDPITDVRYRVISPVQFRGRTLTYGYPGFVDEKEIHVGKKVKIEIFEEYLDEPTEQTDEPNN